MPLEHVSGGQPGATKPRASIGCGPAGVPFSPLVSQAIAAALALVDTVFSGAK
jgi:hypothetical protein